MDSRLRATTGRIQGTIHYTRDGSRIVIPLQAPMYTVSYRACEEARRVAVRRANADIAAGMAAMSARLRDGVCRVLAVGLAGTAAMLGILHLWSWCATLLVAFAVVDRIHSDEPRPAERP